MVAAQGRAAAAAGTAMAAAQRASREKAAAAARRVAASDSDSGSEGEGEGRSALLRPGKTRPVRRVAGPRALAWPAHVLAWVGPSYVAGR
jgi:hypothetical protein